MADVHLPGTLAPLFAGLPRRVDLDAGTVAELVEEMERRWPGIRDRLLEPGAPQVRMHIHFYVDSERAQLGTPIDSHSRVDVVTAISGG